MVADDIARYIGGLGLGLTLGSTGNLYTVPIPETAAPLAASVLPTGGSLPIRAMGASIGSPVAEVHTFQVLVRNAQGSAATVAALAQDLYESLDHLAETNLTNSTGGSTRYLYVQALQPPFYLGEDASARHMYAFNCEARKERQT